MPDPQPSTRVLVMPRRRLARWVALFAVLAAAGVELIVLGIGYGWLALAVAVGCLLAVSADVLRPPRLRLDATGFQVTGLSSVTRRWEQCEEFTAWGGRGVSYRTRLIDKPLLRQANRLLVPGDEAVRSGFGGLSAAELAELLNSYRSGRTVWHSTHATTLARRATLDS